MKIVACSLLVFLTLLSFTTSGQSTKGSIEGNVTDTTIKKAVEFATVTLFKLNGKDPINGTITDDKGNFIIKDIANGDYQLEFSFIGYKSKRSKNVSIKNGDKIKLGKIEIVSETLQLKEVTIEATQTNIEEKVDRIVYNAEKDITNRGGDAADVMRKVPLLTVDLDGNVSLRGSGSVTVLINNKPSSIMAASVADALKQIPADMIKSVEVITSPSAKYDGEGTAGIINIVTKKNNLQGLTLGVDLSAGNRGAMLGLNGNYRKGNMGFSLRGHGRGEYNIKGSFDNTQSTLTQGGTQLVEQTANTLTQRIHGNYNFGWDWDINKKSNLSAGIRFGTRNGFTDQTEFITKTFLPNSPTPLLNGRNVDSKDINLNYDINLTYTLTPSKDKELNILGLYSRNNRTSNYLSDLYNSVDFQTISSRIKNDNPSYNDESTLQIDYQAPLSKKTLIEYGAKSIYRHANSNYTYYVSEGGTSPFVIDTRRNSNALDYTQTVGAGFLSFTYTSASRTSIKAGSRLEYTDINAEFLTGKADHIPSYWSLIPAFNISQPLSKKITLKGAYNKRIQRPGIQFLNPNINESNPTNISVGNPYLSPEHTDNFELSTSFNAKGLFITASTYFRHTNNSITSLRDTIKASNSTIQAIRTTYQNIGNDKTVGLNLFGNLTLFNIWQINGGIDYYHVNLTNNDPNPVYKASNNGWVFGGRMFSNVKFKSGWGIQGGGGARGKQINLQGYSGSFSFYMLGIRKEFKDGKGNVSLSAENFLNHPFRVNSETKSGILDQFNTNSFYNAGIRVGLSYRIGKMSFDDNRRKKSINNDDLKQEGGGGDNGGGGQGGNDNQNQTQQRGQRGNGQMPAGANGNISQGNSANRANSNGQWQRPSNDSTANGQKPQWQGGNGDWRNRPNRDSTFQGQKPQWQGSNGDWRSRPNRDSTFQGQRPQWQGGNGDRRSRPNRDSTYQGQKMPMTVDGNGLKTSVPQDSIHVKKNLDPAKQE